MMEPVNRDSITPTNQYDFSRKRNDTKRPYMWPYLYGRRDNIFEVGFGISDCKDYYLKNPGSGTFMLVIDADPSKLLGIDSNLVTAIPRTPGGFHNQAVDELDFYLHKKGLKDEYSDLGKAHVINGTVGPGRIDLRIDGGNESQYFYKSIEILSRICKEHKLELNVFEVSGKHKLEAWGLAHLKARTPKRTRELKTAINNRKVPFYVQDGTKNTFVDYNYYAFAAGTRYISVEVLNKIVSSIGSVAREDKRLGLEILVNLNNKINLNFRNTAYDIDFLLVNKRQIPLNFKDENLVKLRECIGKLASEATRYLEIWPKEDESEEAWHALNEFCAIFIHKVQCFINSYKEKLPEVLRSNATDTYDWNLTMYRILYGVSDDPWKNLGRVEINASYSLSLSDETNTHHYSSKIGPCSSSPQIINAAMPEDDVISFNQGKYKYRKRSLGEHFHDLQVYMIQALNDENISILNEDNLLPEAMYFGQVFKHGESQNTQAARLLSISKESERYVLILSYPEGEEKIFIFNSIHNFLEFAKISQNRYWKSYFTDVEDSLINYSIDYSDLQNKYYGYLYSLLKDRAEVLVNKEYNVVLNSCDERNFTLSEYVKGFSPKDKKELEGLSSEEFKKYLSKLAVAVVCHIITQKARGIEDDCVYDGENLILINTNSALDPEGYFDHEKDLSTFIYLQTIIPAYNILIRKNAGGEDSKELLDYFIGEVVTNLFELEKKLDFDQASEALDLGKERFGEKVLKVCRKNPILNELFSLLGVSEPLDNSKSIFRDHLRKAIKAFRRTENLDVKYSERLKKIYNFLDYVVPTQYDDDIKHDVLRRYSSILSLSSIERNPFTQDEVIKKLADVITSDGLTTNFTNEELYRNEVRTLDLIYIALDLEVKRTANKKIVKRLPNNAIPRFLDLVKVALRTEKVNDFVDYVKTHCAQLKIPDEKLTRFHTAANELLLSFSRAKKKEDFIKHLVMINDHFEKRGFVKKVLSNLSDNIKLSNLYKSVYSFNMF